MEATTKAPGSSPLAPPTAAPLCQLDLDQLLQTRAVSNQCWTVDSLEIPNIGGKDAIDLMKHKDYDLALPTRDEVYPPTWDGRTVLINKSITKAARQQGKTSNPTKC